MQLYRSAGGIFAAYHGQPIIQYNIGTSIMCLQEHTFKLSKRSIERCNRTDQQKVYAQRTTTNLSLYMLLVQAQCVYRSILHKLSKRSIERCNRTDQRVVYAQHTTANLKFNMLLGQQDQVVLRSICLNCLKAPQKDAIVHI